MKQNLKARLTEMAKEFGAMSFEDTSEEVTSPEEKEASLAPKQHVKRLISAEQNTEFEVYQGTSSSVHYNQHGGLHEVHAPINYSTERSPTL
jgi:hypothetical protein